MGIIAPGAKTQGMELLHPQLPTSLHCTLPARNERIPHCNDVNTKQDCVLLCFVLQPRGLTWAVGNHVIQPSSTEGSNGCCSRHRSSGCSFSLSSGLPWTRCPSGAPAWPQVTILEAVPGQLGGEAAVKAVPAVHPRQMAACERRERAEPKAAGCPTHSNGTGYPSCRAPGSAAQHPPVGISRV